MDFVGRGADYGGAGGGALFVLASPLNLNPTRDRRATNSVKWKKQLALSLDGLNGEQVSFTAAEHFHTREACKEPYKVLCETARRDFNNF